MACSLYEVRIAGQLDTAAAAVLADLSIADLVDARRVRIPAAGQLGGVPGRAASPLLSDPDATDRRDHREHALTTRRRPR